MDILVLVFLVMVVGMLVATWPWWFVLLGLYAAYRVARWWWDDYWTREQMRLAAIAARAREAQLHEERLARIGQVEVEALAAMRKVAHERSTDIARRGASR